MITIIMLSSIQLAISKPLNDPNATITTVLYWIDVGTTIIFFLEAIIKIVVLGFFWCGESSYLRNPWNILDFSIMALSILSVTPFAN